MNDEHPSLRKRSARSPRGLAEWTAYLASAAFSAITYPLVHGPRFVTDLARHALERAFARLVGAALFAQLGHVSTRRPWLSYALIAAVFVVVFVVLVVAVLWFWELRVGTGSAS